MSDPTEKPRRAAKALRKGFDAGNAEAIARVRAVLPDAAEIKHADALHVIAREAGFASWPKLKFARETAAMDRAARAERLKMALFHGQTWVAEALLAETPDLGRDNFGLVCALYDRDRVAEVLARDPAAATRIVGIRRPMTHLAFSQHFKGGGSRPDMLAVADLLLAHGADVNDSYPYDGDENAPLSALYGALGHAGNLPLAEWLLEHGADPNDGESLYHSTELGHTEGLRLLLRHGARPERTNALPRALDFNDHEAVRLLLEAGADPNEGVEQHPSGEPSFVIPALHQAARRMCDARMIAMLLEAGADPSMRYREMTPYSMARVYGNPAAADLIAGAGGDTALSREERLLVAAAEDTLPEGEFIDPAKLPLDYRNLLRAMLHLPGKLPHVRRLVEIGLEYDRPDEMGLTPVQIAGWEGLPEVITYFLRLKPDLSHVNGYGGTLLSTIIHGSENCPARSERDHIACARLALDEGVALPTRAIEFAGEPDMAEFLSGWAEAHPGQVVEGGIG
ncbi:MAG: ankyrin repeat domain-containing protein [Rhodobacter sp.]|nr:ankyrin repeat domain-containing protein [Rhodobacter sp.]